MKLVKKIIATYKVVKNNLEILKKELSDLTGETKRIVKEIIEIWN